MEPKEASASSYKYFKDLVANRDWHDKVNQLPDAWRGLFKDLSTNDYQEVDGKMRNIAQTDISKFIDMLKSCDRIGKTVRAGVERAGTRVPGSMQAANPPVEDGIYGKTGFNGGLTFYKVYWNRENTRLLAKEIVLIREAYTVCQVEELEHECNHERVTIPAMSELQYRGEAYRFVTADDKYNPTLEEAIAFGPQYGRCGLCGRNLNDEISVKLGIGPVCGAREFGGTFRTMHKMAKAELADKDKPQQKAQSELFTDEEVYDGVAKAVEGMSIEELEARLADLKAGL